jgi:hypothetical protein
MKSTMNLRLVSFFLFVFVFFTIQQTKAQDNSGYIRADFQLDAQSYRRDSIINAPEVRERLRASGFLNVLYTRDNFQVGLRYENYANPLLGIDDRFAGSGIPYRFARYSNNEIDVTVGNFYEQFGSGMILRTYEERALGFDNSIDGVRVKLNPTAGMNVTAVLGRQRAFFALGPGIVRGGDVDISLNDLTIFGENWLGDDIRWKLGGSVVSKFEPSDDPILKIPENVLAYSTRLTMMTGDLRLDAEWAYKINDPSQINKGSYNIGDGLFFTAAYSTKGFGATINFKRIDNMDFRSERGAIGNVLNINFLPPQTKVHTYRLLTLYPYATQTYGEIGLQAEFVFSAPKNSLLGGKYGTTFTFNYSRMHTIDSTRIDEFTYKSRWGFGKKLLFEDINLEINKQWTKEFKTSLMLIAMQYDKDVIEVKSGYGLIRPLTFVLDGSYQFDKNKAIRMEFSHMYVGKSKQFDNNDMGNWAFGLAELTLNSNWYFSVWDEYNYGNPHEEKRVHYYGSNITYVMNGSRFSLGYSRQRAGILCVGGVCRFVPAANGFSLSISSTL